MAYDGSNLASGLRGRSQSVAALLLVSLLWSCETLRPELLPMFASGLPSLQKQTLAFALFAGVAALASAIRGAEWPKGRQCWAAALIGLGLFVAPSGLLYLANGSVSGYARTVLLTLVPVFAIVLEPYICSDVAPSAGGHSLLAALASVAGALCVFPIAFPASLLAASGFFAALLAAACIAAANCFAVTTATASGKKQLAPTAAIAGGTATLAFAIASVWLERPVWQWDALRPELFWSAAVELPALLLLFWLLRRLSASRMAARYVAAPLLTVALGAVGMQAELQPRTWLGLILMAAGAGYLILAPAAGERGEVLSLRR